MREVKSLGSMELPNINLFQVKHLLWNGGDPGREFLSKNRKGREFGQIGDRSFIGFYPRYETKMFVTEAF